jgi:hypothetical protein
MRDSNQSPLTLPGVVFIASSLLFNALVSAVYVLSKLNQMTLVQQIGVPIIALIIPFSYTLYTFLKRNESKKVMVSNSLIIIYLLLELILDYVLRIPFRENLLLHVPYILLFYAAEFSILGVSFRLNRRLGLVVLASFLMLLGCLVFSYT